MARSSPGVQRVVAILNFIADHPDQTFTLTDIVRALKLSRATCHALLAGLVEASYLYRTSDKGYVLGPALAAIGGVAKAHFSPLQTVQPELRALADEFDTVAAAVVREGNEVVVRERAASRSHLGMAMPRGSRLPLRPPFGGIFLAGASEPEVEAWMDQIVPAPAPLFRAQMHGGMAFLSRHGFQISLRTPTPGATPSLDWLFSATADGDAPIELAADWEADREYDLSAISAPVLDADGRVIFVIVLQGFRLVARPAEITKIGERLKLSCERMGAFVGNRRP